MPSLRNICLLGGFASIAFLSQSALAEKISYEKLESGDVISVNLDQLLPTQAVMSYDREYAKLGRYAEDLKQMYNDLCKANGAKRVKKWNEESQPTDPSTYTCVTQPGTDKNSLSTVVVGPSGSGLYLTQGHHILSTFWDMPNGGTSVPVMVKVTHNLSDDGDDFWPEMNNDGEVWLYNRKGKKISPDDLPEYLGQKQLKHDKYLSLVYFLNGISYKITKKNNKKDMEIPFFEYHWALALRKNMTVSDYDLSDPEEYAAALAEAATVMVDMPDDEEVGKSGKTAIEMGKLSAVDSKALERLITDKHSDFNYAMAYRQAKKEKTTPKHLLEEEAEAKQQAKGTGSEKEKANE